MIPPARREWIGLVAVLLLAGSLRMGWPGLTEFKADEARLLALALEMAEGQRFPIRGISSSVGFPNFPMSVWLYALPLFLWPHVYAATLFTGLLNTLAVAAGYGFVRRYWGPRAALAATLLFAVSPWAIFYSRKIWAQNLLPLFVIGWAAGAVLALVERRPRFWLLHFFSLAIAVQAHLAAVSLVPATALLTLIYFRRIHWRWYLGSALLAALTAAPFAYYLWTADLTLSSAAAAADNFENGLDLEALQGAILITLGNDLHALAGPEAFRDFLNSVPDISPARWLWAGLILAGIVWLARAAWRREDRAAEAGLIVLVWLLVPILFYLYHTTPVFPHYLIPVYPAPYIAAGVLFAALMARLREWRPRGRWLAAAGSALLGTSAVAQAGIWLALLFFVAGRATPGAFGTPLAFQLTAAERARQMVAEGGAAEVLLAGSGESTRVDEFPAVWSVLLRDVPHRFVDIKWSALFPAAPAVVLLAEPEADHLGQLYRDAAGRVETVPLRDGEGELQVLALPPAAGPAPEVRFAEPALLANWVSLIGYDELTLRTEDRARWQIHWQTGGNPDPADYHFFNHLLDANGQRVAQADAAAFSPQQWRAGDVVVSRFQFPWPDEVAGPLLMRTGMYRYPSLENVPLLDVAANPYSDAAEIEMAVP